MSIFAKTLSLAIVLLFPLRSEVPADLPSWDFDAQLEQYFIAATENIRQGTAAELSMDQDWPAYQQLLRRQLQDMLGLLPFPEKTPLRAETTGVVEHEDFRVEKIHFQALPGLYVTGNLYLPKNITAPAPAIIYVCGHATVKKDGYNYGAKVHYQHHPAWFARHGYVCLILDTLQLAEIEGIHHGLHYFDRWWWISRGYTPAGVEAWNGIRAIDYLENRPEVDPNRIGVTGRSGGGATSWWIAGLDERVQVAVPVAGITDMEDHVVNGCIEGHCDCMYMFNTYQWDFAKVAALVAPRPLLISNTDRDPIFPIEGVFRVYRQVRAVYERLGAGDRLALNVTAGPHQDVQELRIHAFRWFDEYLQDRDVLIEQPAVKFFEPEQLRVFRELPADAVNDRIDEQFNAVAPPIEQVLAQHSWEEARNGWREDLQTVFGTWPREPEKAVLQTVATQQSSGLRLTTYALDTDAHTTLPVFHLTANERQSATKEIEVVILDDNNWPQWRKKLAAYFPESDFWTAEEGQENDKEIEDRSAGRDLYLVSMRGAGPAVFSGDQRRQTDIRKRFYLLGESLESRQTWDIRRSIEAILDREGDRSLPIEVAAAGTTAGMAVYASLWINPAISLRLNDLPASHLAGPHYPRILRYLDFPAAVLMASEQHQLQIRYSADHPAVLADRLLRLRRQFGLDQLQFAVSP